LLGPQGFDVYYQQNFFIDSKGVNLSYKTEEIISYVREIISHKREMIIYIREVIIYIREIIS